MECLPEEIDLQTLSSHIYLFTTTATMENHNSVALYKGVSEPLRRTRIILLCFAFQTLRNPLSKPKDPIPDLQKLSVVYKIPCGHCSASYVGQTSHRLCQRLEEHKRAIRPADFNSSALAEHVWLKDHLVGCY